WSDWCLDGGNSILRAVPCLGNRSRGETDLTSGSHLGRGRFSRLRLGEAVRATSL
ncbi:unnamed protein product, partial [Ascophyllum nodosum]